MHTHPDMPSLHEYMSYSSPVSMSRRSRIQRACIACRRRKIKCNGNLDGCAHCAEKEQKCRYEPVPDDEKLKARSYKRQLIQRRQQTRVYWDRRQFPDPVMYAASYGMSPANVKGVIPHPTGFYSPQPAVYPSHAHTQQLASPFSSPSTSSPMDQDFDAYFAAVASPESSAQLQSITGTSAFSHPIPAPLILESLSYTPALSSSLSSPTLSVSSSSGSLLTPMSETFAELNTPLSSIFPQTTFEQNNCTTSQIHFHDFAGGLELYNVPCMAPTALGNMASSPTSEFSMMVNPAPSAESSAFSSPEHLLLPLPASFNFASSLGSAVAPPTLAVALA
ncbi:uncharacterized protein UTRI_03374_B [Ustilago trichophora]|uniref:Zn(2)-C6 fungal-type domain-containing protein n=1 Tax=Ustilago trichophora TaxID=86804 RepID=A0A5C3E3T0_9BASI|nr:uncharacterized protein UTRI_03374_B [Ustilago trichophora]